MHLNSFAEDGDALDMTLGEEFASLTTSAADLGISHGSQIAYRSNNVVMRHQRFHYLEWGNPDAPPVLLLHGSNQSAHSFDLVSLHLADRFHVYALDQRGHGDSEWAKDADYSSEAMGLDAAAFVEAMGLDHLIVVGHSMGGHVAIAVAARFGQELAGAIILDAPVRQPDPESEEGERGRMFKNPKTYPDLETALEHFHLQPPQPKTNDFIVDHIARHSLREVDGGGWTWKFDPGVFARERYTTNDYLSRTQCRLALMHGQLSDLVTPEVQSYMEDLTGRNAPMIEIPQAYHHIPLDQPLALIAAVRAILADWQHSIDKKRLRDLTG